MKKILITGATGFIGSHLSELCVERGYDVIAFDRYNSNNDWGFLEDSKYRKDMEVVLGDIRDFDSVYKTMANCDVVFHLAALIGIPYSYVSPVAYIKTNIEGTYNVLESARMHNLEEVLITSTSETYGSAQYVPINETHPLVGQSPYSASKIGADQLALSYHKSFDLPLKIVRPFNNYGPRQSARAIIPTIISQLMKDQKIKIGNLQPTRDFTYVKDTCNAYLEILKAKELFGNVVNIGMNKEISMGDLISLISSIMNVKPDVVIDEIRIRPNKSEVDRLCCDNNFLIEKSDWVPQVSFKQGLLETIDWIENNKLRFKSDIYNI